MRLQVVIALTMPAGIASHMAVKLEKRGRWSQVKKYLNDQSGIQVHYNDYHDSYDSAYKFVMKEDIEALHSLGHPDLSTVPKTEAAIRSKKRKGKRDCSGKKKKRREERLTVYDVTKVIRAKSIKTRLQLVCLTMAQEQEGQHCLAQLLQIVDLKLWTKL